jgi:hypothetical protein
LPDRLSARRGNVYRDTEQLARAAADYGERRRGSRAYSSNNRATAKARLGDKVGAVADFRKALEINPGLRTARKGLQKLGAAQ